MDVRFPILTSRNFYLLVALVTFFIVNPFLDDGHVSNTILGIFITIIIILSLHSVKRKISTNFYIIFLAILSFLSYWYVLWIKASELTYFLHFSITFLFFCSITFLVIRSVSMQKKITPDTLFGAICGYLLIGYTWSFIYLALASLNPENFSVHMASEPLRLRIDHFIYYSFVTLTTLGYGDILALNSVPRAFSWLEAACGQIYLAVWISQLVGLRIVQQQNNR